MTDLVTVVVETADLERRFVPAYLRKRLPPAVAGAVLGGTKHTPGAVSDGQQALLDHVRARHQAHGVDIWRDGSIHVVRPGKPARRGSSASIIVGQEGDTLLTVFSDNWTGLAKGSYVLGVDGKLHHPGDPLAKFTMNGGPPPSGGNPSVAFNVANANDWADNLLGQQLADKLRPEWRHVTAWKQWVRWDGRRWAIDEIESVHELARLWMLDLGAQVLSRVTTAADMPRVRKVLEYRRASAMENVVKVARRILAVEPTVFDRHLHLLNAHNGVVDLRTGRLTAHDPALMMTRLAGAAYDQGASHIDAVQVFSCLDRVDVPTMHMLLGVAATGHTGGDHLPVWDGTGGNGKTTLLLAAAAALGDYAGPVPPELVMKTSREDHPTIKTTLHGLRLAYIEETEEDGGLRLERVKAITGGAPIPGRKIGGNYYQFLPSHTLILATNHRPSVNSAEHAAWRRLHLIPFPHRYSAAPGDHPIDPGLRDRLRLGREQREAMLAVMVAGAVAAYAAGSPDTPTVRWSSGIEKATEAWREDEDVIHRFATTELEFDPDTRVTLAMMFSRYKSWCESGNRSAGTDKLFARRFEAHDVFRRVRRTAPQHRVTYVGVKLR